MKARMGAAIAGAVAAILLAVLGGCAALPTINPDMAWSATPVRVEGGRGPLSAEQSKAVLEKLKSRPGGASIFDRHLALEEAIVGSPLVAGQTQKFPDQPGQIGEGECTQLLQAGLQAGFLGAGSREPARTKPGGTPARHAGGHRFKSCIAHDRKVRHGAPFRGRPVRVPEGMGRQVAKCDAELPRAPRHEAPRRPGT